MAWRRWSAMRHKLEHEYLAECLKGHIQYFATSFSRSPDHEGRAAIRYNGREILRGNYYNNWTKAKQFPKDEKYERRMKMENAFMDDVALELGVFDQRCFYEAFREFDSQGIQESLQSENELVRIFAIFDRRVGKRKLLAIKENIGSESKVFREFFAIRMLEEGLENQ